MLQTKNKFYKVTLIFYSILSVASTIYLLFQPNESVERYNETKQELEYIKSYLQQRDADYQKTIDSLKHKSDSLQSAIHSTDYWLENSRTQSNRLSGELNDYVSSFDQNTSLVKNEIAFDSLSALTKNFMRSAKVLDSLCTHEIHLLTDLVQVKDSIIDAGDSLLGDYKSSVEQLLETSSDLNKKLKQTEKKLKRKTRFNRALSLGVVLASGYVIYKIL